MKNFVKSAGQASSGQLEILDFYLSTGCVPCIHLSAFLDELNQKFNGTLNIQKIDVMKNADLAIDYKVRNAPTIFLIRNNEILERMVGFDNHVDTKAKIEKMISDHLTD